MAEINKFGVQKLYDAAQGISLEKMKAQKTDPFLALDSDSGNFIFKSEYERRMFLVGLEPSQVDKAIDAINGDKVGLSGKEKNDYLQVLQGMKTGFSKIQQDERTELEKTPFAIKAFIPKSKVSSVTSVPVLNPAPAVSAAPAKLAQTVPASTSGSPAPTGQPAPAASAASSTPGAAPVPAVKSAEVRSTAESDINGILSSITFSGYVLVAIPSRRDDTKTEVQLKKGDKVIGYFTVGNPENDDKKDAPGVEKWAKRRIQIHEASKTAPPESNDSSESNREETPEEKVHKAKEKLSSELKKLGIQLEFNLYNNGHTFTNDFSIGHRKIYIGIDGTDGTYVVRDLGDSWLKLDGSWGKGKSADRVSLSQIIATIKEESSHITPETNVQAKIMKTNTGINISGISYTAETMGYQYSMINSDSYAMNFKQLTGTGLFLNEVEFRPLLAGTENTSIPVGTKIYNIHIRGGYLRLFEPAVSDVINSREFLNLVGEEGFNLRNAGEFENADKNLRITIRTDGKVDISRVTGTKELTKADLLILAKFKEQLMRK